MSHSVYRVLRPFRQLNRRFGLIDPEEIFHAMTLPRILAHDDFFRTPKYAAIESVSDDNSTVTYDKNKFQANLDVQHFKPEEISVKITGDRTITIEGKHEENEQEKGQIYRQFMNRFILPKECDMSKIESKLSSDGILTITAPRIAEEQIEHQSIPIMQTGEPAKIGTESSSDKKEIEN